MSEAGTSQPDREHNGRAVLVTAASRSAEIAEAIGKTLKEHGLAVAVIPPGDVGDLGSYDAVIFGSAVYAGHWLDAATDFASRYRSGLAARLVWLFSSGPVGDPAGRLARAMATDPAEVPAIREATRARDHQIFAGKLDRMTLPPVQRAVLLAFPGLTGDFRDWASISQWAAGIARELTSPDGRR